jgi:protein tyrosine phosphatase
MRWLLETLPLFFLISSLEAKDSHKKAIELAKFPTERCHLYELEARAHEMRKSGYQHAREIIEEIDTRVLEDPKILSLTTKDAAKHQEIAGKYHHPFDKNRSGRNIKGLFINASDVRMKYQHFILAACPKTLKDARNFFEAALDQDVPVYVSALRSTEARHHCNNFWRKKSLKKITLRDDSKIEYISSTIIAKKKKSIQHAVPQLIESTLYCSRGTYLTHLHYEGWQDKRGMPSEKLLTKLLDRLYELSPDPSVPIAINCRGGTGRSGTIAVSLYLRRLVDAKLAAGKTLDEITVNIPEIIYSFRRHRTSIIGTPAQLAQIYSVLAAYYERLKVEPF